MKPSHYLVAALAIAQTACTTVSDPRDSASGKYRVTYKDTNKDGYIDSAFFTPGGIDGDFVVKDTDFDGRYDSATVFGIGIFRKSVDYPVYMDERKVRLNREFLSPFDYKQPLNDEFMKTFLSLLISALGLFGCAAPQSNTTPAATSGKETPAVNEKAEIAISSAVFGTGVDVVDVTPRVTKLLLSAPRSFLVSRDSLGVDPLPYERKCLVIDYSYYGKPFRLFVTNQQSISYSLLVENAKK